MADTKITALTAITTVDPAADVLPIVDVSDTSMAASGTTKKITSNQILGAGGTATLASATITGNLTLSAGTANGVGYLNGSKVLTAGSALVFDGTNLGVGGTGQLRFATSGGAIGDNSIGTENSFSMMLRCGRGSTSNIELASDKLVFGVAATEQMRLNSTGLGVGVSPDFKFAVNGTQAVPDSTGSSTTNGSLRIGAPGTGLVIDTGVTAAGAVYGWIQARARTDYSSNFNLVLQPNGGNVGIGLTPSASKLQVAGNIGLPNSCTASGETSGVFSIDVANLLTLNGSNWRQASILIVYSGIDGAATNATVLQTVVTLSGLSTWNTIAKNDIVGTASVAVSASTATGATITFTVPTGNTGSVYAMLLGGGGSTTRPSMTVNA